MLRHQTAHRPVMGSAGGKKTLWLLTMVAPGAIWLILIRYLPMFGIVMVFLDYRLPTRKMPFPINLLHSDFVGLDIFGAVSLLLCFYCSTVLAPFGGTVKQTAPPFL